MSSSQHLLTTAVQSTLAPHIDTDTCEYINSLLTENTSDEDAREAVLALIEGSVEEENAEDISAAFFQLLDSGCVGSSSGDSSGDGATTPKNSKGEEEGTLRKLEQSVTLKEHDVQTFASGLVADQDPTMDAAGNSQQSQIATFYANMIDPSNNPAAVSERTRRKMRQKELREKAEEEERRRAIDDAMNMLDDEDGDEKEEEGKDGEPREENAADVHLRNFDLPNLRGGGPDLLSSANVTLARGRRYGLMGRNGCGKTTLLTLLASRSIPNGGVPKNMSMLLVRQEIVGNDWSAVETVLKSDVRREGVKRWITKCEEELDRLEKGDEDDGKDGGEDAVAAGTEEEKGTKKGKAAGNKNRQKLRERKKSSLKNKAAKTPPPPTSSSSKGKKDTIAQRKTKLTDQLAKAYEKLAQIERDEGGDPEPRARKVLSGLGFTDEMQDKPTRELSGGWRMRVSLSCALFASPSLLLLDEPTNHLDLEAVLWLERYLTTKFSGTLVVVSHDRHFLNEVVTDVVHFHRAKLTNYRGDVSNFEAVREENRQRQLRLREVQESKREHLQKYIELHAKSGENGVKAARQRKSKMKKLDKLGVMAQEGRRYKASYDGDAEEVEEYKEDEEVILSFPDPGSFDGDIAKLEQVTFGYTPEAVLLKNVDLSIDAKSRIALLGRNGCGKSTLIKLIVGALHPVKGKSTIDARAKIEYLSQHQLEQLDPDETPMQTMLSRYPADHSDKHALELRRYLARFGLGGEILPKQRIHTMSGGQKCRLCLASAMYREPHLLVLDEPTNHLDLETTAALIDAIRNFRGGVLLVSHDQHLITSVCKSLYVVEKGTVEKLRQGTTDGEAFEAYKKAVVQGRR